MLSGARFARGGACRLIGRACATLDTNLGGRANGPGALRARGAASASDGSLEPDSLWAANRITLIGAGVNVASAASKGAVGVCINSPGLLADAAHSLTDLLSDVVTLWAVNHARVPASCSTPWGLGKLESVGGSVCAGIIVVTGLGVGAHSALDLCAKLGITAGAASPDLAAHACRTLSLGAYGELDLMLCGGVLAAIGGVLAKEWLYRETLRIGNETRSTTMVANAWHHRTDALSSFVALGGLLGAAVGFPALDALAGLAVAAMVTRVGGEMGVSAVQELVDSQVDATTVERVRQLICSAPDVVSATHVRGRKLGPWLAFDLRVQVPFAVSVSAAKQIATKAKLRVLQAMPEVYDVLICIDAEKPVRTDFSRDVVVGSTVQPRRHELMRSAAQYDHDVRAALVRHALGGQGGVWGVTHANVHWHTFKGGALVEACLVCDPRMSVGDVHALSRRAHDAILATVPDVIEARALARSRRPLAPGRTRRGAARDARAGPHACRAHPPARPRADARRRALRARRVAA